MPAVVPFVSAARQMSADALRLFHTVRHLKPEQILGRVTKRLRPVRPELAPAPARRRQVGTWAPPAERARSLFGRWRVRFLNEEGEIASPRNWNDPSKAKLWLYNLHYFDDLVAAGAGGRRDFHGELIARWIYENPPGSGNGWEPYPVSLRVVNWIKWALAGAPLAPACVDSLAVQVRWLMRRLEWHLLGNHLLANAKALVFAGLFFIGDEAERWLSRGIAIYEGQLPEQILADGGHFELSPMYHAIILEDLLDLANLARAFGKADAPLFSTLPPYIARMRTWLAVMTHPDGGPSFFNDVAFGIAPNHAALEAYAARIGLPHVVAPGEGVHHLAASGYIRVARGDMTAILDVAAIGPDYISGHAHADTLSFELSLGSERIVVNGGTSTYAPGVLREQQRATASHSTVEVGGENSSEVWASFRVARRAQVHDIVIHSNGSSIRVSASHDGYRRLKRGLDCHRTWIIRSGELIVSDRLIGRDTMPAVATFHFHPAVDIALGADAKLGSIRTINGRCARWTANSDARVTSSAWHPEFGRSVPGKSLRVPFTGNDLTTKFEWS